MKVSLVAMPWHHYNMPQASLGVLSTYLRQQEPTYQINCHYAYLTVFERFGDEQGWAYDLFSNDPDLGELVYATHLYPERLEHCKRAFLEFCNRRSYHRPDRPPELAWETALAITDAHLNELAAELAGRYQVVGLSISCMQLFGSLSLAERFRRHDTTAAIVLGGSGIFGIAPSILEEYPPVDFIIEGEGETRLAELLRAIDHGETESLGKESGILRRQQDERCSIPVEDLARFQLPDLDDLPVPSYDEYYEKAEELEILWDVPCETTRGCWWNRANRSGDPLQACYFCGLDRRCAYREKSEARVVKEMLELAARYQNVRFRFLDNAFRQRGGRNLAQRIAAQQPKFMFFSEIRANISPEELLALKQAGCTAVQIGVEGLSTAYLRRINKGTTTIQNLQAMKLCYELGISTYSNLIVNFPGATPEEVAETVANIMESAIAYPPLWIARFILERGSSVCERPERFSVVNIRTSNIWHEALPPKVAERVELMGLDFDLEGEQASWKEVEDAVSSWRDVHDKLLHGDRSSTNQIQAGDDPYLAKLLYYMDGGTFLEIVDRRSGYKMFTLEPLWREVYLYCMRSRRRSQIEERFADAVDTVLNEILPAFVEHKLMFCEGERYLALAVAWRPELAIERIESGN